MAPSLPRHRPSPCETDRTTRERQRPPKRLSLPYQRHQPTHHRLMRQATKQIRPLGLEPRRPGAWARSSQRLPHLNGVAIDTDELSHLNRFSDDNRDRLSDVLCPIRMQRTSLAPHNTLRSPHVPLLPRTAHEPTLGDRVNRVHRNWTQRSVRMFLPQLGI
jgi:hypothetical protein